MKRSMKNTDWALIVTVGLLLANITFGASVKCYICSWSPDDNNNRTDFCTDANFQKNVVVIDSCKKGCEVFIQWDANARMEHIRRNCMDDGDDVQAGCNDEENGWWLIKRCKCVSNLCNDAKLSTSSGFSVTLCASAVTTSVFTFISLLVVKSKVANV